jgi:pimeloyl-ACP methyl ester carboxylesterase
VGQGEPIILIHGLSGSSRWWVRNIPILAEHYRLYLIDLPGFGTMRHYRGRLALDEIASGIVMWMEAVGIKQAHLVGHSMGGYICLWIAAHHRERIQCLVLVSPAGIPHIRSLPGYALPLLVAIRYLKPRFFSILISDALRAGPLTIVRAAQDLLTKDIRDCLKDITAPTLLIWGEYDSLVPLTLGDILNREISHAHLLILKKAGHVSMFDQPKQFNAAVLTFLAEHTIGT